MWKPTLRSSDLTECREDEKCQKTTHCVADHIERDVPKCRENSPFKDD